MSGGPKAVVFGVGDPDADALDRMEQYARRMDGEVHFVIMSRTGGPPRAIGERSWIYPSGSRSRAHEVRDAYRIAAGLHRTRGIDVIYTQDPFGSALVGVMLKRRFGTPLIIGNHSSFLDNQYWISERPGLFWTLNQLARRLLPRADAWRVSNTIERDKYVERLGIPAERVQVSHAAGDVERFAHFDDPALVAATRARLGIPEGAPVLLWAGRPIKVKRLPVLFDTFRRVRERHPGAWLVLVGNRKLAQEDLSADLAAAGPQVVWKDDGVPYDEIPAYFRLADVYVHPSTYEGMARVILEAAASELPVVATATGGAPESVIEGKTGFLVPVDDAAALCDRVCRLIEDPAAAARMGRAGREFMMAEFGREHGLRTFAGLLADVASGKPPFGPRRGGGR